MAKKSLAMMPWFPRDFHAATRGWSFMERAIYRELLDAQWDMGVLPEAIEKLAKIVAISEEEFSSCWPVVKPKFTKCAGGIRNAKLEQHRKKSLKIRKLRAQLGSKGGKAKAVANAEAKAKGKAVAKSYYSASASSLREDIPVGAAPSGDRDPRKILFDLGVSVLGSKNRSLIGKAVKEIGDQKTAELLAAMAATPPMGDPVEYFCRALQPREQRPDRFRTA